MAANGDTEPQHKTAKQASELEQFDDLFPVLLNDLTDQSNTNSEIKDALEWFKEVSEYNVPFGKKNRGLSVVTSYKMMVPDYTDKDVKLARILGWCVEWLQAFLLMADDIMDGSTTRRGKPCWYKKDNVGVIAVNDAFYLETCVYDILRKYFRSKPYYVDLIDLFHETTSQTVKGQCLDLITAPAGGSYDLSNFTIEKYDAIVKWKTSYYSFYLPVASAMYMAGITDSSHNKAKDILLKMGRFFQIQDDYLDCYGDPVVIGKIGTDIQENKCSWLVVQALAGVNPQQEALLQENYGCQDDNKVAKVKELYKDLNLSDLYLKYEEESYQEILTMIDQYDGDLPKEVFVSFVNKIYKRKK